MTITGFIVHEAAKLIRIVRLKTIKYIHHNILIGKYILKKENNNYNKKDLIHCI